MGALGTLYVIDLMRSRGMNPIELERHSSSNKIWTTKVKRLRVPDLICTKTGIRLEVRSKSKLAVKMSDAPNNPDRRWFASIHPEDMIAFVHAYEQDGKLAISDSIELFSVQDLLNVPESDTRLGAPKSPGEGAEQDREWPTTVTKKNGEVLEITDQRIVVSQSTRRQPYRLNGKVPYVAVGDQVKGLCQFIAGPPRSATFPNLEGSSWNPRKLLSSDSQLDRFAAVKVLGVIGTSDDIPALIAIAENDPETRVRLEAYGSLSKLGSGQGVDGLRETIQNPEETYFRMEAVFILSEVGKQSDIATVSDVLVEVACDPEFVDNEVRQAAIWGLGKSGLMQFDLLSQFLGAEDLDERIHAINAYGEELPESTVAHLVDNLDSDIDTEIKASIVYVLSNSAPTDSMLGRLTGLAESESNPNSAWAIAVLGSMNPVVVNDFVNNAATRDRLTPMQLLSEERNWIMDSNRLEEIMFVSKQSL